MRDKERGKTIDLGGAVDACVSDARSPSASHSFGTSLPEGGLEAGNAVAAAKGKGDKRPPREELRAQLAYAEREFARKRREDALPVKHISLGIPRNLEIVQKEIDGGLSLESNIKYIIQAYEREVDAHVMAEIVEIGRAAGVSDIFLLDKPKITAALLHAVPLPPKEITDILCACPSCGAQLSPFALPKHCEECGQAIDREGVTT